MEIDQNLKKDSSSFIKEIQKRGIDFKKILFFIEELERQGLDFESFLELIKEDKILAKELFEFINLRLQPNSIETIYLAPWQRIYRKWFGVYIDISGLKVPENYDPEKHFLILVAKGITVSSVISAMRKKFNVWLYAEDLDFKVTKNDRIPENESYLALFNRSVKSDEEFKNISAIDLVKKGNKGITLLERLLLEVLYFDESNKNLDFDSSTLCLGSRLSGRKVPEVGWYSDRNLFYVHWRHLNYSYDFLSSRFLIS